MKHSKPHKYYGHWLPWTTGTLAFAGLAGTLFALSEVLENDSDGDGWTDAEEIVAGTDPADATEPWNSDVFMKHWMLRYWNGLKMLLSVFQATSSVIIQCSGVSNDTYEVIGRPAVRNPQNGILEIKRINP